MIPQRQLPTWLADWTNFRSCLLGSLASRHAGICRLCNQRPLTGLSPRGEAKLETVAGVGQTSPLPRVIAASNGKPDAVPLPKL